MSITDPGWQKFVTEQLGDVTKPLWWSPELSVRLSLQHSVSRRNYPELSARLCICIANGLLLGSLERGSRWMLWFFFGMLHLGCAFVLQNPTESVSAEQWFRNASGLWKKRFFLHFTALFSVRTASSKFLRVLFCNVKCFSLLPT